MTAPRLVECTIPILPVRNLPESVRYYTQTLGFISDWGGAPGDQFASVSRDGCSIMLAAQSTDFAPAWVWIGLDSDRLFDEFRERGVRVVQEPRNFSWAWEMKFADPDGNVLWLGTEPRGDRPCEDC